MAVLQLFKESNILENNIVQTAASAGESLAAGVIFTLPALILLRYWSDFPFLDTMAIAMFGGVLGVLFTIPLRRALIIEKKLKFPEGVATGEVLKADTEGGKGIKYIGGTINAVRNRMSAKCTECTKDGGDCSRAGIFFVSRSNTQLLEQRHRAFT